MLYAIGKPNQLVRQFVQTSTEAEAALQCGPGETYVRTSSAAPGVIASGGNVSIVDGKTVAVQLSAEEATEQAWLVVKQERNTLLDQWRWTIQPDSPLSAANQDEWLTYMKALNRVTIDFSRPEDVQWPNPPTLQYPETASGNDATMPDGASSSSSSSS